MNKLMNSIPEDALKALYASDNTVFLDTSRVVEDEYRSLLFTRPVDSIAAWHPSDCNTLFARVEKALSRGFFVAGWFSYEWGYALIPQLSCLLDGKRPACPLAWLGVYENPVIWNRKKSRHHLAECTPRETMTGKTDRQIQELDTLHHQLAVSSPVLDTSKQEFENAVNRIKEFIAAGDTYQVNYTVRCNFQFDGDPLLLYRRLRSSQRVSYGAVIRNGSRWILSLSPELFFHRKGEKIWSKPMKGTMPRGASPEEDRKIADFLSSDRKNRAENVMIVDLLRNDIGRIAQTGSVKVPELFQVEEYETLFQMISRIEARIRPGTRWEEIFQALFPCGSITGAPKIRTMEIISQLEKSPRGVYTGAIGFISPEDEAVFNVAIRTVELEKGRGTMGTGCGITIGSDAEAEYREAELKARFLQKAVSNL